MRILLNGLSVFYPISGVGRYTVELAHSLKSLLGERTVFLYGRDPAQDRDFGPDQTESGLLPGIHHHVKKILRKIPGVTAAGYSWESRRFRSFIRRFDPSLYHETKYAILDSGEIPTVTTVYDLSFLRHPEWHPGDRVRLFEKFCLKRLPQVEGIITISEFSRREIMNVRGVDPGKIHVTPLGISERFHPGLDGLEGLPERYILFLGNLEPRKNLTGLLNAYRNLPRMLQKRHPLVIAGAKGWGTKELDRALRSFHEGERPILAGYIPQRSLPRLYGGAAIFVYPSLYEGFGLPVLEAMASGVPVITSSSTSLPEVVGDAGMLVNPLDTDDLRRAMVELLEDENKRQALAEEGIRRAKLFSWENCARQTLSVYARVLGKDI
jgi:alpha-1,3-rhamnosyl/mannosyltransferase